MARSPAIVPLRNNDLTALNRFATAVRQRLDQIDTEFVANPVTQAQLGALQAAVQRLRNDLDELEFGPEQQAATRNLFIQADDPQAQEPSLWIKPVFDAEGLVIDASLILRTP